jgi:hypothetical protein
MQKEKVIKSNIFQAIAAYIIGISFLLFGIFLTVKALEGISISSILENISDTLIFGILLIAIGLYMIVDTLMAVQKIIITPEKIVLVGNIGQEELTHEQIFDITLSSMRQHRRGLRSKIIKQVVVHSNSGDYIKLTDRLGNPEFLFDTLIAWWKKPNINIHYERD